ncbi:MAG: DUF1887 family protein [Blastocatellia bacterium]|nr:DUF1887 family protein [Blastocatellia bacterium]
MTKQALLILVGGRPTPNLLTALHLQPELIVSLVSSESLSNGDWEKTKTGLTNLCPRAVLVQKIVDAHDLDQIKEVCEEAIKELPETDWIFNLTCASKIMFLGAYEIARSRSIPAWYLDTPTQRVVPLTGFPAQFNPFRLSVEEYFRMHGREMHCQMDKPSPTMMKMVQSFAQVAGRVKTFRQQLLDAQANLLKKDECRAVILKTKNQAANQQKLLEAFQNLGLISGFANVPPGSANWEVRLNGHRLWKFVNGDWLEIWAWVAAQEAGCFEDAQFNIKLPLEDRAKAAPTNELDFAATCQASLVIAECKTDAEPFKNEKGYLDKINSVATLVGGNAVSRLFISSRPTPFPGDKQFQNFLAQAKERRIVVVTGEELPRLSRILKREAGADPQQPPTFGRN